MSNLVIVAIPEEQDRTWKISSEQVPHLTLLFLGDEANADTQQIVQFVDHAVTMSEHGQFYLDVERRGTLGPDDADVLFFSKRSWNLKWIKQFRGQLLQNQAVRSAYDSTQQYEEWLPHLTLGYPLPGKPAEPLSSDDHPIYSVCFDRIAVWTTDFDGPEFQLEWPDRELEGPLAVAYSDTQKAAVLHDSLEHHGVKGMKWGLRKAANAAPFVSKRARNTAIAVDLGSKAVKKVNSHLANRGPKKEAKATEKAAKKLHKADVKWEKNQFTLPKGIERHNAMAEHFNQRIGGINDKYAKDDFSKTNWAKPSGWTPREKQYHDEIQTQEEKSFRHAVEQVHGTSPSGLKKMDVKWTEDGQSLQMHVRNVDAKHAAVAVGDEVFNFSVTRNAKGLVTKVEPVMDATSTATHGEVFVEGLMHQSVLDNATLAEQIKAKIQSILDDVTGDAKDVALFGDPLLRTKIKSVLEDFYKDPNVDNAVIYDALGESFIEHFGIKGMKWGVRNRKGEPTAVSPTASSKVPQGNRRKTKIKAEGGQNHDAHPDALKVAEAKVKLKKSGAAALSNQELRDVANRVQLENQVKVLTSRKGEQFVRSQFRNEGQNLAREGVRTGVRKGVKRAGVAAALA